MRRIKTRSKGFTLVEILLVVGFIALASIGIYAVYNKVATTQKVSETARGILAIKTGIEALYGNQSNYTGLTNSVVINGRIAPPSMINGGNLVHPFGGTINVFSVGRTLYLHLVNIPDEACSKLLASTFQNWTDIQLGGAMIGTRDGGGNQLDWGYLQEACNESETVELYFIAIKR